MESKLGISEFNPSISNMPAQIIGLKDATNMASSSKIQLFVGRVA